MSSIDAVALLQYEQKITTLARQRDEAHKRIAYLEAELAAVKPLLEHEWTPVDELVAAAQKATADYEYSIERLVSAIGGIQVLLKSVNQTRSDVAQRMAALITELQAARCAQV